MKKLLLIATTWMIFSSCAKNVKVPDNQPANDETAARVAKANKLVPTDGVVTISPTPTKRMAAWPEQVDNLGWVLRTGVKTWVVPDNLPEEFRKPELQVVVDYYYTGRQFDVPLKGVSPYMIHIIKIGLLNPEY